MTPNSRLGALVVALFLGAACTSNSQLGMVLRPETTATLQVLGDNPFVRVDNDGPGPIDVSFTPSVGSPDRVRVLRGSTARSMRGGGMLQFVLVEGDEAHLTVDVRGSTGFELSCVGTTP